MMPIGLSEWFEFFKKAGISFVDIGIGIGKTNTALTYAINFDRERISIETLTEITTNEFR